VIQIGYSLFLNLQFRLSNFRIAASRYVITNRFMQKLLILSSNTGEGHNSAAAAIQAAAAAAGLQSSIRKPLEESGHVARRLANLYNTLLTRRPQWMTNYLRLIDFLRPNEREFLYRTVRRFIETFLETEKPGAILSVHPMLNHSIPRFIKEHRLKIPVFTFLTDPFPPFWRGWASPYIDRYFVVREEARRGLLRMGVEPSRIEEVPMPVRPEFQPATMTEIQRFRAQLDLDGGNIILVNGGARGGGPVFEIYQTVKNAASAAVNILVICGRNEALRTRIEQLKHVRTRTFGFVTDIHRFIAASDLVLTKPGAMSTYEALACRVPPVLLGILALMPQESGMFHAASRHGFGYSVSTFPELTDVIRRGRHDWERKRQALRSFYQSSSGRELIERIQPVHARA
jgi:UDP-N-acetylglucosamine:LPS N-acetylglucosamine transferase